MLYSQIPAATDSQIISFGDKVKNTAIVERAYGLSSTVGRMVVYHDNVEREGGLLIQSTCDSIFNSSYAVINWYDDGCFINKLTFL